MHSVHSKRDLLKADMAEVDRLIGRLPPTSIVNRQSLLARKKEIEKELAELDETKRTTLTYELTFQGQPVDADRGILAKFGTEALRKLTDAISLFAASASTPLGARGSVPKEEDYRLMITDIARGSFGFVLEAELETEDEGKGSDIAGAVSKIGTLILEAEDGTDEELAEVAEGADGRAVAKLHDFLNLLANQGATFAFHGANLDFGCRNKEQVLRAQERLNAKNIIETKETKMGTLIGVLPNRGMFEFKLEGSEEIIGGRIDDSVDPTEIKHQMDKKMSIVVRMTRVGKGQPRYLLMQTLPIT